MSDKFEGFFGRWNQRRQQVAEEKRIDEQSEIAKSEQQENTLSVIHHSDLEETTELEEQTDKQLTAEDLPDPNTIEIGGSFAAFMGKNVDPSAKTAALRALWKQPHFNEIDGLLEYGLDYSNQPKLSAEDSAALVKKVFRNIYENTDDKEPENSNTALSQTSPTNNSDDAEDVSEPLNDDSVDFTDNSKSSNTDAILDSSDDMIKKTNTDSSNS